MEKIIEAILKLVPFGELFQKLGLGKEASAGLSVVIVAVLVYLLAQALKNLSERYKNHKTAGDLKPQFDYLTVQRARDKYIPTQFQNASPSKQDEPGFTHKFVSRSPLIPFLLKTAFDEQVENNKFYLILADSGMGKTTFMINLYVRYHSFFNFRRKHKMKLLRLGDPRTLDQVKSIKPEDARNTILLLDALDEDPFILPRDASENEDQAFRRRVNEITEAVQDFCEVVITCRTQYFPGQEDDPYELQIRRPDEKGFYVFSKIYLSPFTLAEAKIYLRKVYGRWYAVWNRSKKRRALQLVANSPKLVVRPMLLNYIEDLVDAGQPFETVTQIYHTLIEKWLHREAEKRKQLSERSAFIENLHRHAQQTAVAIYRCLRERQQLFLTKTEALAIAETNNIELKPEEITGQSLLTSDALGNWKFAHKSILEYFLAKEAIENPQFFKVVQFSGMDMAEQFFSEMLPEDLTYVRGGTFSMGSDEYDNEKPIHVVTVSSFCIGRYPVTFEQYDRFCDDTGREKPSDHGWGRGRRPAINVSWLDATAYCAWLSAKTGHNYRLPTEAEWEYAAKGGAHSKGYPYAGGGDLKKVAWFNKNSAGKTHPVGEKEPNELGLYDMSGNVWEWCGDWYGTYDSQTETDPTGPGKGDGRVFRGGSWYGDARLCRVACRDRHAPTNRYDDVGFRLVCPSQSVGLATPAFL